MLPVNQGEEARPALAPCLQRQLVKRAIAEGAASVAQPHLETQARMACNEPARNQDHGATQEKIPPWSLLPGHVGHNSQQNAHCGMPADTVIERFPSQGKAL